MGKYLAIFSDTLNDIEINGFVTMTDKEMERFELLATSITWDFEHTIGEEKIYFSSGEDLLSKIDFKEISNEEYKTLKKIFKTAFGFFISEETLEDIVGDIEAIDEDLEEDDDDDFNDKRRGRNYDDFDDNDY